MTLSETILARFMRAMRRCPDCDCDCIASRHMQYRCPKCLRPAPSLRRTAIELDMDVSNLPNLLAGRRGIGSTRLLDRIAEWLDAHEVVR